jgi:phosphocarrier protein
MIKKSIEIVNKLGLHARAAAKLVSTSAKYESHIELEFKGKRVNGKSIMGVMMLAASQGSTIDIMITGTDQDQAMLGLETLINNKFGEGE